MPLSVKRSTQSSTNMPYALAPEWEKRLWQHQRDLRDKFPQQRKALWNADTGTGKTLAALAAMAQVGSQKTLILTVKKALHSVWGDTLAEALPDVKTLVLYRGTTTVKSWDMFAHLAGDGPKAVVVNYESAFRMNLNAVNWDMVIADESHKLQSHSSQVSRKLARMLEHVPYKIAMTGTPWEDRPLALYGQERWLEPINTKRAYPGSRRLGTWTSFYQTYGVYYMRDNIPIFTGWKNLDQLADIMQDRVTVIRKEDVLDLPPVTHITVPVEMSKKQRKVYNDLERDMAAYINGDLILPTNALVQTLRLHQLTSGYYTPFNSREVMVIEDRNAKVDTCLELVEEIGPYPIVIFTAFKQDVTNLAAGLKKLGIEYRQLTGAVDEHQSWQQGAGQVLLANIQAGGTGINLTRASYVIYFSTGHGRTPYEQSLARTHRPGQTRNVTYYHLIMQDSIDEMIQAALECKGDTAKELQRLLIERYSKNGT